MKVAFCTLGCKVNQNDTEGLIRLFQDRGYEIAPFEAGADIYVINTCAVTCAGASKSRRAVSKAVRFMPKAVVVTGCYSQAFPADFAGLPGVRLLVGMAERPHIVDLVTEALRENQLKVAVGRTADLNEWIDLPPVNTSGRTRAMLKIEEGCEQFCSYCVVPYARGKVRSMPSEKVIANFRKILERGFKEVVLTGIHLGVYGQDLGLTLNDILKELVKVEGDFRIRLGSIEPSDFNPELLRTVTANRKICRYLHIPLQSGCDRILKLMNRVYNTAYYDKLLAQIRELNPLMGIGTDLIVGFPGETEADFEETRRFVKAQAFSRAHVFRYSPRRGTPAAALPGRVAKAKQEERSREITAITSATAHNFAAMFTGRGVEVLFEEKKGRFWTGLSSEYLRVETNFTENPGNNFQVVTVNGVNGNILSGVTTIKS